VIVLLTGTILGIVQRVTRSDDVGEVEEVEEVIEIGEVVCEEVGGAWNDCGSACRGAVDEELCIELCVEYCECESDQQCPSGSACIDIIDEVGVCA